MSAPKPHKSHKSHRPGHSPKPGTPHRPSGRVTFDDRGNATWQWDGSAGSPDKTLDTAELKALGADLSVEAARAPTATHHDPYNRSTPVGPGRRGPKKRSLDDLRRLSEEIKAAPYWKDRRSR